MRRRESPSPTPLFNDGEEEEGKEEERDLIFSKPSGPFLPPSRQPTGDDERESQSPSLLLFPAPLGPELFSWGGEGAGGRAPPPIVEERRPIRTKKARPRRAEGSSSSQRLRDGQRHTLRR